MCDLWVKVTRQSCTDLLVKMAFFFSLYVSSGLCQFSAKVNNFCKIQYREFLSELVFQLRLIRCLLEGHVTKPPVVLFELNHRKGTLFAI